MEKKKNQPGFVWISFFLRFPWEKCSLSVSLKKLTLMVKFYSPFIYLGNKMYPMKTEKSLFNMKLLQVTFICIGFLTASWLSIVALRVPTGPML